MRSKRMIGLLFAATIPIITNATLQGQLFWDQPNVPDAVIAQGYTYRLYVTPKGSTVVNGAIILTGVTCTPMTSPDPNTGLVTANCQAPLPQVTAVGGTSYGASLQMTAAEAGSGSSESSKSTPPYVYGAICLDPQGNVTVKINVGTWTQMVPPQGIGQVLYSLLQSKVAITRVNINFNGTMQDQLQGSNLNKVAGSYFQAAVGPGSYKLTAEAYDINGCKDGGDARPMTVTVTP